MSQTYDYNKTPMNIPRFKKEILEDQTIVKTLESILYNVGETPNNLHITFAVALTSGEETALDTLVTNHTGASLGHYRMACTTCDCETAGDSLSTPTTCPCCGGSNISGVLEEQPYVKVTSDNATLWGHYQTDSGTTIIAKEKV